MKFLKVQVLVKNRLLYTLILVTNEIVHTVWPSNDVPAEIVSGVSLYILFGYTTGNSSQLKRYIFLKTLAGFASDLANFTRNSPRGVSGGLQTISVGTSLLGHTVEVGDEVCTIYSRS